MAAAGMAGVADDPCVSVTAMAGVIGVAGVSGVAGVAGVVDLSVARTLVKSSMHRWTNMCAYMHALECVRVWWHGVVCGA